MTLTKLRKIVLITSLCVSLYTEFGGDDSVRKNAGKVGSMNSREFVILSVEWHPDRSNGKPQVKIRGKSIWIGDKGAADTEAD